MNEVVRALKPLRAAVEALCRMDANLLTADANVAFTLENLESQSSSLTMKLLTMSKEPNGTKEDKHSFDFEIPAQSNIHM